MIRRRASLCARLTVALALIWPSTLAAQFTAPPAPAAYGLQNVTLVHADGRREVGVSVVIRGGLIDAIGPDVQLPPDALLLEGDSLYLYPGIIDAQGKVDYKFPEIERNSSVPRWDPPRDVQGFMPSRQVVDFLTAVGADLDGQRRAGVVAAAIHPEGRMVPGRGALVMFRADVETPGGLVIEPTLGPTMTFSPASGVYPSTLFGVIAFYRQIFEDAGQHVAHVRAFERDPEGVRPPKWDADLDVMSEAMSGNVLVFFAVDFARDIQRVLSLAEVYGFKPVIVGGDEAWKVADELEAANVTVLVSLDFPEPERWKPEEKKSGEEEPGSSTGSNGDDELDAAALREKQRIEDIYANAGRLEAADVAFALTSGGSGDDIIEGARTAIEYGLSEEAALRALTATPAALFEIETVARIDRGLPATFVVTDGPLFEEETAFRYTFVEGVLERGKVAASGEAPTVDVTGTWELTIESEMGTFSSTLILTQDGNEVEGTYQSEFGGGSISDGSVSGNSLNFKVSANIGGEDMTFTYTGTVEGDSASGSLEGGFGSMSWTAKRTGGPEETRR